MSDRFADRAAVRDKIEWEGGLMESLDYGLRAADMPEGDTELIEAWGKLYDAFHSLEPLTAAVQKLLDEGGGIVIDIAPPPGVLVNGIPLEDL